MRREEIRSSLMTIFGNDEKIQFGFPMKEWHSSNGQVDGRLIHRWLMDFLNPGESFHSHNGSMILDRKDDDVIGHYDSEQGVWIFTHGRIRFFRKPRVFAGITWKDLSLDKIVDADTHGLLPHEGDDYLAVFPSVDSTEFEWAKVEGLIIDTDGLPTHLPMAVRFLHGRITRWIRTYDCSTLKAVLERGCKYYGEELGRIDWLSSIFEQPFWKYELNPSQASILKDYRKESRDVKAVREIWRYCLSLTNRPPLEQTLSEADYEIISIHYLKITEMGQRLFNVRNRSERRALPILEDGDRHKHFTLLETETKAVSLYGKFPVATAPLAANVEHDLISISTFGPALREGLQNHSENISPEISVRQLYFLSDVAPSRVIKISPPQLRWNRAVEGNYRELQLHLALNVSIGSDVVSVRINGSINTELANVKVWGNSIVIGGESYTFVGYDLDFERIP